MAAAAQLAGSGQAIGLQGALTKQESGEGQHADQEQGDGQ